MKNRTLVLMLVLIGVALNGCALDGLVNTVNAASTLLGGATGSAGAAFQDSLTTGLPACDCAN